MSKQRIKHLESEMQKLYDQFSVDDGTGKLFIEMFPYPSGKLHVGHLRTYIYGDVLYRYKRLFEKENYIRAIGWDAFGLPAENAAKATGKLASEWTAQSILNMKNQLKNFGILYDWSREITTCDRQYYSISQDIFKLFVEKKFIYKKYSFVNWDPIDETVLANEQVIDGKGWRSGAEVEKKLINSWYFNLSSFSEYLYDDLSNMHNWNKTVCSIQKNWISRSNGYILDLKTTCGKTIKCFTKAPKCIEGIEFCALALDHDLSIDFILRKKMIINFSCKEFGYKTDYEVICPITGDLLPVYIADYVLGDFGTGAVYGAPSYSPDADAAFYKRYVSSFKYKSEDLTKTCEEILDLLGSKNVLRKGYSYKLRDWNISRQRIWGCPIPTANCPNCNLIFYNDAELDAKRLTYLNYNDLIKDNLSIFCNKCGSSAPIDCDTLDTFFDSSWYFMAYLFSDLSKFNMKKALENMPVSYYIGGIEHANLHLLYSRAFLIALSKCFDVKTTPPFDNIINQGFVLSNSYRNKFGNYISSFEYGSLSEEDKGEKKVEKMSKSKLNVYDPIDLLNDYSLSSLRVMIMSNYPIETTYVWDSALLCNVDKFVNRIEKYLNDISLTISLDNLSKSIINFNDLAGDNIIDPEFKKNYNYILKMYKDRKINNAIAGVYSIFNTIKKLSPEDQINYLVYFIYSIYPITPSISDFYMKTIFGNYIFSSSL